MNAPFRPEDIAAPVAIEDEEALAARKAKRRRLVLIAGGALTAAVVGVYILTHQQPATPAAPIDPRPAITVAAVAAQAFTPTVALSGIARPVNDIQVYAPGSGVRILALMADEGQTVRAGQPLARLDQAVSAAQIRAAEATVAEARAAAVQARDEYNRAESIRASGALSTEQIESRRTAAEAADARLAAARAQLAEVNARLQGGYIRAPAAGLIIDRTAEVGRLVDGQPLFRIAGDNRLEVAADVAEADILALRVGQTAAFRLANGAEVMGTMRRGAASIDERTRTGQVLFALERGGPVRAGMYLRGEARLAPRESVAVGQDSILYADGLPYLFTVDANNRVRRTSVRLGMRQNGLVEVLDGVAPGTRIAGSGAAFLQDGDEIRPVTPAAAPAESKGAALDALRGRNG
jgi:RND family efflux transporter MFP subunit